MKDTVQIKFPFSSHSFRAEFLRKTVLGWLYSRTFFLFSEDRQWILRWRWNERVSKFWTIPKPNLRVDVLVPLLLNNTINSEILFHTYPHQIKNASLSPKNIQTPRNQIHLRVISLISSDIRGVRCDYHRGLSPRRKRGRKVHFKQRWDWWRATGRHYWFVDRWIM